VHVTVKAICRYVGFLLLLVGALGFTHPDLFGMHLTTRHSAVYLVSGLLSLYFGWVDTLGSAYAVARAFAALYLGLAALGVLAPHLTSRLLCERPLPGREWGPDNIVHAAIGSLFLIGAASRALGAPRRVSEHVRRGAASSVDR
jgi:hypothetical protein